MALTHISVRIANPARPRRFAQVKFLVDSGAVYSVVPTRTLEKLGVKPHSRRTFILADGSEVTRRMGDAVFRLDGRQGASPVIFGEKRDSAFLGAVTLESLGVLLDPLRRELRPLPMVLAPGLPR
jgi:clan AA aspartic protease